MLMQQRIGLLKAEIEEICRCPVSEMVLSGYPQNVVMKT